MNLVEGKNYKMNIANDLLEQPLAAIYLRSATDEHIVVNRQKELCERFAEKNNIKIVSYIKDIPKSGMHYDQNDLIKRVQTIKDNISFIIVASFDRISRKTATTRHCIEQLKQLGITILSVTEDSPKMNMLFPDHKYVKE